MTLRPRPGPVTLLYVDVLNFGTDFLPRHDWKLRPARARVAAFVAAAAAAGITLKAFIDAAMKTDATLKKWRKRREGEVLKGEKEVPQGTSILLGDMFRAAGVPVLYSLDADCDDTLASHAAADGADVLSGDSDLLFYTGRPYRVFREWVIRRGILEITLWPARIMTPRQRELPLITPPPSVFDTEPTLHAIDRHSYYLRGAPTPLVRALRANPHVTVRPLRQALYALRYAEHPASAPCVITEEFPVYDGASEAVMWDVAHVAPDASLMAVLVGDPAAARDLLFLPATLHSKPPSVSAEVWRKHLFGVSAVVAELCGLATGKDMLTVMLGMGF